MIAIKKKFYSFFILKKADGMKVEEMKNVSS